MDSPPGKRLGRVNLVLHPWKIILEIFSLRKAGILLWKVSISRGALECCDREISFGIFSQKIPQGPCEDTCAPSLGSRAQPGIWELLGTRNQTQVSSLCLNSRNSSSFSQFPMPWRSKPAAPRMGKKLEYHRFTHFGYFPWNFGWWSHLSAQLSLGWLLKECWE